MTPIYQAMTPIYQLLRVLTALLVLGALLVTSMASAKAQEPLVQLVRGTSYQILEDSNSVELRIPIILRQGVSATDVTAETVDVALGQLGQGGLTEAFKPTIQGSSGSAGPALVLTIPADRGLQPGTYDVILLFRFLRTGAGVPEEQRLNIQVAHPAAILESPPTLIIERTLPFLPFLGVNTEPLTLRLRETSRQSRVSQMTITQVNAAKTGDETVSGSLLFKRPASLDPGGVTAESFSLSGDFPVGITNGSVLIDAAQLQTPVTINFEVRTRRSLAWIFFVAAAGLLIGALARTWLKGVIALQDARVQAGEMLQTLNQELARRPDQQFQQTVRRVRDELGLALRRNDPKVISDATSKADTDLQAAIAALIDRRKREQVAIDDLFTVFRTPWSIPPIMSTAVTDASTALSKAATSLAGDDVSGATAQRTQITSDLVRKLDDAANQWATDLSPILDFLSNPEPPLKLDPDPAVLAGGAKTQLHSPQFSKADAQPRDVLSAAADAGLAIRALLEVPFRLHSLARDVLVTLRGAGATDEASLNALAKEIDALTGLLPSSALQPTFKSSQELTDVVQTLLQKIADAISEQLSGFSDDEQKPIRDSIAAGQYGDAASATAKLLRKPAERPLGATAAPVPVGIPAAAVFPFVSLAGWRGVIGPNVPFLETVSVPSALDVRLHRDRQSLLLSQLLQAVLLGIVLLVIAYVLYSPHFIGTASELAAIFLWAFAIDITVDAVITAAKGASPGRSAVGVNP